MRRRNIESFVLFPNLLWLAHRFDDLRWRRAADAAWSLRNWLIERAVRRHKATGFGKQSDEKRTHE